MTIRKLAPALASVVAAGLLLATPGTSYAGELPPPPKPPAETPPSPTPGPTGDAGSTATGQVGNCSVVSSPSYLGLSCGSGSMTNESIKQILGDDPVPGCWDDPLTGAELEAMGLENTPGPDGSTWYWERCLKGIDKKTKKIEPGGVHFTVGLEQIENGSEIRTLTHNQEVLVDIYSRDEQIPYPIAGISPMAHPRVGADVSFFDGTDHEVTAQAGAVTLRAHVVSIDVKPLGEDAAETVHCDGWGYRAVRGDTPKTHPKGCWYRYLTSSADQDENQYPVKLTAHWQVEVSAGGGFTPFNTFDKSQVTNVPVSEIQSLVVR